ncbi:uncharacterized protein PITG_08353 [Phytophthora infestans T30-4]|uniref:Uncharacterized protein n=1 Tax=Phytophthora infestans (strain T30-4) TaxID=403677 RepID=D0NAE5_PHYIT|nr:uncharacterized protein PITG_08353 [Phytophthora infestans T30-4]EEY54803.1 hypothetical protein PITG_08353 [Phytophthora infestans T30-4]|eukprot:XP_002903748.1 hypothetical protein PITG_08353 [Phytophthora infestans T30-4]
MADLVAEQRRVKTSKAHLLGQVQQSTIAPSYYYLCPGAFNVVGFAYGKAESTAPREGKVKVKRFRSGRWVDEKEQVVELHQDEPTVRIVSAEEALHGAGTFVESVICTAKFKV